MVPLNSISKMIASGNRLTLPKDEIFPDYANVKKVLVKAGGIYRSNGFDFKTDAQEIKDRLTGGEKIDDKKKYQQFFTPRELAKKLVKLAEIERHHLVLEPEAGLAAIASIIVENGHTCTVVEINPVNVKWLERRGWKPVEADFLTLHKRDIGDFDRIIANPPFAKNQDIDHIRHMYKFLKPGGVLVSMASRAWQDGYKNKHAEFREWLQDLGADVTEVPAGAFKESGTGVATCVIKITKQDA